MQEETNQISEIVQGIEFSMQASSNKHQQFVDRHKHYSGGTMGGFYKAICLENDPYDNDRVEAYWRKINPNINNLWEFKHLSNLRARDCDEVIDILKTEAVTDVLIEINIIDREQFCSFIKLGKAIYGGVLAEYLERVTFFCAIERDCKEQIDFAVSFDRGAESSFNALCKKVEVSIVERFDPATKIILTT